MRERRVCQACDSADFADRPRARGALGCECGVARPSVKGQPVDVKQSILHAWHQPPRYTQLPDEFLAETVQVLRRGESEGHERYC